MTSPRAPMPTQWKPTRDPVTSRFTGSKGAPRYTPAAGTPKTCSCCHDTKPIEEFGLRRLGIDGHDYYCKDCRAARGRQVYHARKNEVRMNRWRRSRGDTLLALFSELLDAAEEAKHHGLWRGRLAIRSYKRLGDALDALQRDGSYDADAMERDASPLHCPPVDADHGPQHRTPERYRGRLVDHAPAVNE